MRSGRFAPVLGSGLGFQLAWGAFRRRRGFGQRRGHQLDDLLARQHAKELVVLARDGNRLPAPTPGLRQSATRRARLAGLLPQIGSAHG
ncbi:hypothetical protein G6F23_015889 [Rhizopus arrhizus]|nr:hypothetical protein G6F23_015889 [Rhizopus arrhizus]